MSICEVLMNTKPQRNDPCPCGSGKKYKKCCALVEAERASQRRTLFKQAESMTGKNLKDTVVKLIKGGSNPLLALMPQAFSPELNATSDEVNQQKNNDELFPESIPDDLLPVPKVSPDSEMPK